MVIVDIKHRFATLVSSVTFRCYKPRVKCRQKLYLRFINMSAFSKLLEASAPFETIKNIAELKESSEYVISEFKKINTRFGERVVIIIGKDAYFLPPRYARTLCAQEDIDELNSDRYLVSYGGQNGKNPVINFTRLGARTSSEDMTF